MLQTKGFLWYFYLEFSRNWNLCILKKSLNFMKFGWNFKIDYSTLLHLIPSLYHFKPFKTLFQLNFNEHLPYRFLSQFPFHSPKFSAGSSKESCEKNKKKEFFNFKFSWELRSWMLNFSPTRFNSFRFIWKKGKNKRENGKKNSLKFMLPTFNSFIFKLSFLMWIEEKKQSESFSSCLNKFQTITLLT